MAAFSPSKRRERRLFLSVPTWGAKELPCVQEAFATNWLSTTGPNLTALEHAFSSLVGLPGVALSNGTAAVHLGIKLLGIRPGDEVVTPTLTFAASCNPLLYERAKPVFLDAERASWNLDPRLLADFLAQRARRNKLPRAVTVVHLYGQSADLDAVLELCRRYDLPLLEDAAPFSNDTARRSPTFPALNHSRKPTLEVRDQRSTRNSKLGTRDSEFETRHSSLVTSCNAPHPLVELLPDRRGQVRPVAG